MRAEVRCGVFGEFDLKFEISDVKYLVKFGGKTFRPASEAPKISGRISNQFSAKCSETSFQSSRLFSETSFSRRAVLIFFPIFPGFPRRAGFPICEIDHFHREVWVLNRVIRQPRETNYTKAFMPPSLRSYTRTQRLQDRYRSSELKFCARHVPLATTWLPS